MRNRGLVLVLGGCLAVYLASCEGEGASPSVSLEQHTISTAKAGTGSGTVSSTPGGINCGESCIAAFPGGAVVTLTAQPDAGSVFEGWSGSGCSGLGSCQVTMAGSRSVTATFIRQFALTIEKEGTGSGTVSSSPIGIACGGSCSAPFSSGTVVTLTAQPDAGSVFEGWSGSGCSGRGSCQVTMTEARNVTAAFARRFPLTVAKEGTGDGIVTSDPAGIDCGGTCEASFETGTVVTLAAAPASGSVFAGWSGAGCSGVANCEVTMTEARSVTATFNAQFALTVAKEGTGAGTVTSDPGGIECEGTCSVPFESGTVVTLTAEAAAGSVFDGWSGSGCAGTGTCQVTMTQSRTVTATFTHTVLRTLTVSKAGAGTGTVTSAPVGIDCGSTCSAAFGDGTVVTLTADPAGGSVFEGWSGSGCSGDGTCLVTMSDSRTVTATFGIPAGFNIALDGVHLNQANQAPSGGIGGVAERGGILRVVVRANEPNDHAPEVRVRLYQGASLLREATLTRGVPGVPTSPNLDVLSDTWNLVLAPGEVVEGLAVEAEVDPGETISETTRTDNRFPQGDGASSLDVESIPTLNVHFIPIHLTIQDQTGNIENSNGGAFLDATGRWIPTSGISFNVAPAFSTDLDLKQVENWGTLLGDIQALRTAEGATDQYYHGIVPTFSGIPIGGIAYLLPDPGSTFRSGLTYDGLPGASGIVAHELGHNMGRQHAPCGNPGNPDPSYPYPDAVLGHPGWDVSTLGLIDSNSHRDYMSYCGPRWTSDYTYGELVAWRRADPLAADGPGLTSGEPEEGLLVWGRMGERGVDLNPAVTLTARPRLPSAGGRSVLTGWAGDGTELFRFSFDGVPVADGPDPEERHFAFFVPLGSERIEALERIEVSGPEGRATRMATAPVATEEPGVTPPGPRLEQLPGDRARLEWDAERHPLVVLRDRSTGRILSFVRSGNALLSVAGMGAMELEILVSDGVRSVPWRPE